MKFIKMHGIGNDFVVIDNRDGKNNLTNEQVAVICDRHKGVGCDQLVMLENSENSDVFMRFFNPDGSESGACGNASRCVASLICKELNQGEVELETSSGVLHTRKTADGLIAVNMGKARTNWEEIPLAKNVDTLKLPIGEGELQNPVAVSMGNPHAVFFVDNGREIDLDVLGSKLEYNDIFPERANIGVVDVISDSEINLRVFERGAGETLACGSGACAAVFASNSRGLTGKDVKVNLPGGALNIKLQDDGDIIMTGTATFVFEGIITL